MSKDGCSVTLDCGAWPVELRLSPETCFFRERVEERFAPLISTAAPEAVLDVTAAPEPIAGPPTDIISLPNGTSIRLESRGYRLEYDIETGRGKAVFRFSGPGSEMSLLNSVLHVLIGVGHVLRGSGLLVHAAAVKTGRGEGWVFPGRSGAGKSTLARRFSHETLLNDETVLLSLSANGVVLRNVPLKVSRQGAAVSAPLKAIVFLEHGRGVVPDNSRICSLSPVQTAGLLVSHVLPLSPLFTPADRSVWFHRVLPLCVAIARERPACRIHWCDDYPEDDYPEVVLSYIYRRRYAPQAEGDVPFQKNKGNQIKNNKPQKKREFHLY